MGSFSNKYVLSGPRDGFHGATQSLGDRIVGRLKSFKKRVLQVFPDECHTSTAEWILRRAAMESSQLIGLVEPGNVAIIFCHSSPHYTPVVVALLCLGIVCVPINYNTPTEELFPILGNLSPDVMLCPEQYAEPLRKVYDGCPILVMGKDWDTEIKEPRTVPIGDFASKPAFYLFTSGTTGIPKKITLTHGVFTVALNSFRRLDSEILEDDVLVTLAPPHWYVGFLLQMLTLDLGCKMVVPGNFSMNSFCHLVALYGATVIFLMPTQIFGMCKSHDLQPAFLSSVKFAVTGGSVLNSRAQKFVESRLGVPIVQWYGTTEIQTVTSPFAGKKKAPPGSIGKLRCWVNAKVVNSKGAPVKANTEGELLFNGPYISPVVQTEWFNTGDIGYYDDDEYFYVVERKVNVIMYRGVSVYPSDLELLLQEHHNVLEAAVTGIPRSSEDCLPAALVVPRHPITAKELQTFVEENVHDKTMHLRGGIFIVLSIPKTSAGKLKRAELMSVCQAQIAESIKLSRMGRNPSKNFKS